MPLTQFPADHPDSHQLDFLAGGGELGVLTRAMDWGSTPLGPVENWPRALRTAVRIMLTSRQPMFVWWGEQLINLCNDVYRSILGGKHPQALGQPANVVWREIWDQVEPRVHSVMSGNSGTYDESLLLIMERYGYPEETYYTFSYVWFPMTMAARAESSARIRTTRSASSEKDNSPSFVNWRPKQRTRARSNKPAS